MSARNGTGPHTRAAPRRGTVPQTGAGPQAINGEEDPPWSPTRRKRGVRVTTAAVAALGLALAGASVAGAASSTTQSPPSASGSAAPADRLPGGGSPPAAVGTVKSVGDDTFAITTRDGTTVTVNVSSSTTYRDHDVSSPSLANVTVGEQVAVFGTDSANVVTATSVAIGAPPAGAPGGASGSKSGSKPSGTPPAWSASGPPS
jgi:hypothetical protein